MVLDGQMRGAVDFSLVFDRIPSPYMLLDADLRYVAANAAYLEATATPRESLVGRYVFDVFPSEGETRRLLEGSFLRARDTGQTDALPIIRYTVPRPARLGGGFETRIWSATHTPIPGPDGKTAFILQHTQDVTELEQMKDVAVAPTLGADLSLGGEMLQRARTVQAESDRLRKLVMQTPSFIATLRGPDHVFELVNNAYRQVVGHRDVVGQAVADALPEVVEQGFIQLLDGVYRTGEAFVGQGVRVMLQRVPNGGLEESFFDFIYQPIFEADGSVSGIFVEGYDVTENTRAVERQRLLLDELNHRVKNTLATVQAIAQQTLRRAASPEEFARTFEARVLALSQTHNALTDSQWSGADLSQILHQELSPYGGARVSLEGAPAHLSARVALSLGMVFHELATNAAKYGALTAAEGRLVLTWRVEGDRLRLRWCEEGGPPVVVPSRRGFGSRLIERSIGGELGGKVSLDYAPGGLCCDIDVPLGI